MDEYIFDFNSKTRGQVAPSGTYVAKVAKAGIRESDKAGKYIYILLVVSGARFIHLSFFLSSLKNITLFKKLMEALGQPIEDRKYPESEVQELLTSIVGKKARVYIKLRNNAYHELLDAEPFQDVFEKAEPTADTEETEDIPPIQEDDLPF